MQQKYLVCYCFLDSKGEIEKDEMGERIFNEKILAKDEEEAIKKLKEKENFISEVEILEVIKLKGLL